MAVIYMPKRQDAWAQMLPQILGQMVRTKFEHNLAMEQADKQAKLIQQSKPDAPEGMFAYHDGRTWRVTTKPVTEDVVEKRQIAKEKREKKAADIKKRLTNPFAKEIEAGELSVRSARAPGAVPITEEEHKRLEAFSGKKWSKPHDMTIGGRKKRVITSKDGDIKVLGDTDAKPTTPVEKRQYADDLFKRYKSPVNMYGEVEKLNAQSAKSRMLGWVTGREIEEKRGVLSELELNAIEQALMTDMRLPLELRQDIQILRMSDKKPTLQHLRKLIKETEDSLWVPR